MSKIMAQRSRDRFAHIHQHLQPSSFMSTDTTAGPAGTVMNPSKVSFNFFSLSKVHHSQPPGFSRHDLDLELDLQQATRFQRLLPVTARCRIANRSVNIVHLEYSTLLLGCFASQIFFLGSAFSRFQAWCRLCFQASNFVSP